MSVDRSVLLLREFTERLRRTTGTERRIVKEETVFDKHDNNQFSCKSHLLFHFSAARLERHNATFYSTVIEDVNKYFSIFFFLSVNLDSVLVIESKADSAD